MCENAENKGLNGYTTGNTMRFCLISSDTFVSVINDALQ